MALTDSTPTDTVINTGDEFEDAVQNTVKLLEAFKQNFDVGIVYDHDLLSLPSSFPVLAVTYVNSQIVKRTFGKERRRITWQHHLNIWYFFANVEQGYRERELRIATGQVVNILLKYPTVNGFNNGEESFVRSVTPFERPLLDGFAAASLINFVINRDVAVNIPITTKNASKYL